MGAHVAGVAGKSVRRGRVNSIVGCDPAGPLFSVNDPFSRIAPGDANHVECIHTDSRNFGIGAAICDGETFSSAYDSKKNISFLVDWFPNGGSNQPGCLSKL